MTELNLHTLNEYSTDEIRTELAHFIEIIERRYGQKPPAPAWFWTAVAARQRLIRELEIRKNAEEPDIALPADRLPLYTVEANQSSNETQD